MFVIQVDVKNKYKYELEGYFATDMMYQSLNIKLS